MNLKNYLKTCTETYHTTLDPESPGVVRIHLVPPKKLKPHIPWVVIINGYSVLPLQSAWAVLLKIFIETLNGYKSGPLSSDEIKKVVDNTCRTMKTIFKNTEDKYFKQDLNDMIITFKDLAAGKEPDAVIGYMSLSQYGKYMSSPHRMDLMISAMEKDGHWNCNANCVHCYASGEVLSDSKELSTKEWMNAIDKIKKARISQITFTGGEPTLRDDLVQLVDYSKWFLTRLNTNGILLTKELCRDLKQASLDSVQVTLYSSNPAIHNLLVGGNHFEDTVRGIQNAIEAGLDVSINTPLCSLNKDYKETVMFGKTLGIRYFSCSGLIPTGNAKGEESKDMKLSNEEITKILEYALAYAESNQLEIAFTSPGWVSDAFLKKHRMQIPSCGACLSNMAISPNGDVIPCQSWLKGDVLGNILEDDWKKIWNNKKTKEIRKQAMKNEEVCLLKEGK